MFIDILKSLLLGLIEGITEFLPISSTGHLIIINEWVSFSEPFTKVFDVIIQLGAILAVVIYFFPKLWPFGKEAEKNKAVWDTWKKTIVAVLPALIIGGILGGLIQEKLFSPFVVASALIIGGLILIYVERKRIKSRFESISQITYSTAFFIGLIQCLSMIPGTSRSASTIIGAIILGASRTLAVEFSFFLAIPTMLAATGYSILKGGLTMNSYEIFLLIIGFISAFLTALLVIKFLMKYIKSHNFESFAYYRIVLGILVFLYFFLIRVN